MKLFKEQYKNANDSIPVNEELLKSLIAEAEKPRKVIKFKNIYKYGTAIAAALVLVVSAIALSSLTGGEKTEKAADSTLAVVTAKPEKEVTSKTEDLSDKEQAAPVLEYSVNTDLAAVQNVKAYNDETYSGKIQVDESLSTNDKAESEKDAETDATLAMATEEMAVMRASDGSSDENRIGVDEYLGMFGIDLTGIVLPEGVSRADEFISAPKDENGNIVFCELVISYFSNNKTLTLTVSQSTDYVSQMINLYPSGIAEGEDGFITAYVINGNNAYIADCINFSVNEVEALASSLK